MRDMLGSVQLAGQRATSSHNRFVGPSPVSFSSVWAAWRRHCSPGPSPLPTLHDMACTWLEPARTCVSCRPSCPRDSVMFWCACRQHGPGRIPVSRFPGALPMLLPTGLQAVKNGNPWWAMAVQLPPSPASNGRSVMALQRPASQAAGHLVCCERVIVNEGSKPDPIWRAADAVSLRGRHRAQTRKTA